MTALQTEAVLAACRREAQRTGPPFFGMGGNKKDLVEFSHNNRGYKLNKWEQKIQDEKPSKTKGVRLVGEKNVFVSKSEEEAIAELPSMPHLHISDKSAQDSLLQDENLIVWQIIPLLAKQPKLPLKIRDVSSKMKTVTRHVVSAKYGGLASFLAKRRHIFAVLKDKDGVPHAMLSPSARTTLYKRWAARQVMKRSMGVSGNAGYNNLFSTGDKPRTVIARPEEVKSLEFAVASHEEADYADVL